MVKRHAREQPGGEGQASAAFEEGRREDGFAAGKSLARLACGWQPRRIFLRACVFFEGGARKTRGGGGNKGRIGYIILLILYGYYVLYALMC